MTANEWFEALRQDVAILHDAWQDLEYSEECIAPVRYSDMPKSKTITDPRAMTIARLDRQADLDAFADQVTRDKAKANRICDAVDEAYPNHQWGRMVRLRYAENMTYLQVCNQLAPYLGKRMPPTTLRREMDTALEVMTNDFFAPRHDSAN